MEVLTHYNFDPEKAKEFAKTQNWAEIFKTRRDSIFCFAVRHKGKIYAVRDHLGITPLYYRLKGAPIASHDLNKIVKKGDEVNEEGAKFLVISQTPKLVPVVKEIEIVPPGTVLEIDEKTRQTKVLYEYHITPAKIKGITKKEFIKKWDQLFTKAIKDSIQEKEVGLYLSGGMDSALIAITLNKLGVKVNGYTSAPWGLKSSEVAYSKINAKVGKIKKHTIDSLKTETYLKSLENMLSIYGIPHAETTAIAVSHMWSTTNIGKEKQIYFGQNSDTLSASVSHQNYLWWTHLFPGWGLLKKIVPLLQTYQSDLADHYITLISEGLTTKCPDRIKKIINRSKLNLTQKITMAGMLLAHSPRDGEVLFQPGFNKGIIMSDPYYNIDLVELYLGLPFRFRMAFSRSQTLWFYHEKKILRWWALKYLPKKLVYRKKAFTVSLERNKRAKAFQKKLPTNFRGLKLAGCDQKVSTYVFSKWIKKKGLKP